MLKNTLLNKRYLVLNPLGKGGFGITYLCLDRATGEHVALKEFFPKEASRSDSGVVLTDSNDVERYYAGMQRFLEEASILSTINDVRIVRVFESFEQNGTAYYVMEYVDGPTLKDFIRSVGPLDGRDALRLIEDIARGLKAIHDKGFIHGDLKPTNIMLKKSRLVKIMDFGAATTKDSFYTPVHSNIISWNYSSPERFRHEHTVHPGSDIYSLGCVLFFLVSGFDPTPATERLKGVDLAIPPTTRKIKYLICKSMSLEERKRFANTDLFLKASRSYFNL